MTREFESELQLLRINVESHFNLDDLFKKTRKVEYVDARRIFVYWIYSKYKYPSSFKYKTNSLQGISLKELGEFMGGLDHATMIHYLNKTRMFFHTKDRVFMKKWESFTQNNRMGRMNITLLDRSVALVRAIKNFNEMELDDDIKLEALNKAKKDLRYGGENFDRARRLIFQS